MPWHIASKENLTSLSQGFLGRNLCEKEQCPKKCQPKASFVRDSSPIMPGCLPTNGWWGFLGLFQHVGKAGSQDSKWPSKMGRVARPDTGFLELMGSLLMSPAYSKAAIRARRTKAVPADSVAWATVGMSLSPGTSFCSIHFPHLLKNTWSVSFCFENKHPLGFHTLKANPFSLYWCSYLSPLPSPSEEVFFFYSFGIWLTIYFSMLVESWEKVEKDLF